MNIEKRKVTEAKPLPVAAKSALAATLGLTVASTFIACMGGCIDDTPTSIPDDPQPVPSSTTPNDEATPESSSATEPLQSSSEQAETSQSSSSQMVVDIPLSHEPISSSVLEALSSALESSSSAAEPASSESVPASSASQPTEQELKDACQGSPGGTSVDIGGQMYLCPNSDGGVMFSMISTFERTDAEV